MIIVEVPQIDLNDIRNYVGPYSVVGVAGWHAFGMRASPAGDFEASPKLLTESYYYF